MSYAQVAQHHKDATQKEKIKDKQCVAETSANGKAASTNNGGNHNSAKTQTERDSKGM